MALEDVETYTLDIKNEGDLQDYGDVVGKLPGALPDRWANFIRANPRPTFLSGRIECMEPIAFLADGQVEISTMLGLNSGNLGLTKIYDMYADRVLDGLVPLASPGPNGDQIFYAMGTRETGKVFYWWHEAPTAENARESLCLLATSIDDFFNRVEPLH